MAGYTRVDTINNIADGNVINAADLDGEFDGIQAAFNFSTGHNHDGTAGEGAPILALGPVQDVTISTTVLGVKTNNTVDIGTTGLRFKDFYLAGNASVSGTLGVTGVATLTAQPVLSSLTASQAVFTDASKGLVSNAITGTGNVVMSASPTLTGTLGAAAATFSGAVTLGDASADAITVNGTATFNASPIISVTDNTNAALRITQLGTGNALLVEDSTNPDSTPFVIDASGNVVVGYTASITNGVVATTPVFQEHGLTNNSSSIGLTNWSSTAARTPSVNFNRSAGNAVGTRGGITVSGTGIGALSFSGDDGTNWLEAARIESFLDATGGTNDMPGRLVFSTTADGASVPTERMRIDSAGGVGIGSTSLIGRRLVLSGTITGATTAYGEYAAVTFQSDVTTHGYGVRSQNSTQATAFTLTSLSHFGASQGTIGAGSTVTNQYGFNADSSLIGATNNYGFYGAIASGTGRYNFYAAGTAENFFGGNTVVSVTDNTNAALRITQLGTGNALLVEDSTNPDSTPFVIDASGQVIVGNDLALTYASGVVPQLQVNKAGAEQMGISRFSADTGSNAFVFLKSRGATINAYDVVASGDGLGSVNWYGSDGTAGIQAASVSAAVDGTPGTNDMPGRLVFSTTADGASTPTEHVRITSAGKTGFATAAPAATVHVAGDTILSNVNVLGASYDNVSFSIAGEELTPSDLFFSPDGLKMYIIGTTGDDVNEYNLSTAWVVSSAVFVTNFSVASQETGPTGLFFRADGTKMYIVGQVNDTVFQYTLSTPWSVATASYDSVSFSVGGQDTTPNGIWFKPNGLSMYMVGATGDAVYQYTLSTAWNVSTATFLQSFSIGSQESIPNAVTFTGDGSRMFLMGQTGDDVNVYNLTTPWDISTSAFVNVFSVAGQDIVPQGLYIKPDGTKMYMVGSTNDAVYQYTVPSIDIQLTGPTSVAALDVQQDLYVYGNTQVYKISASSVATFSAGTVALPAITTTGDTNTGIFFPAADTIAFSEGGAEAMRIDSSGRVGIGTSSPAAKLDVRGSSSFLINATNPTAWVSVDSALTTGAMYNQWNTTSNVGITGTYTNHAHTFVTNNTERMRIDSSGNVGIGTSSPSFPLTVVTSSSALGIAINGRSSDNLGSLYFYANNASTQHATITASATEFRLSSVPAAAVQTFYTNGSERARIDSSGNLLVGATATSNGGKFLVAQPTAASQSAVFQSTNATAGNNYGVLISYTAASPNGTGNDFLYCQDSTQLRASFRSNGGLANFSANNVNLSDERTKTDIQNAGSYLSKICAIPVRTFKYKDQTDDLLNLGVIAQEVEKVAPELVDVSGFGETPKDGVPLKAIYQTDLQYALMKCIQEQQALITALTARITALENK